MRLEKVAQQVTISFGARKQVAVRLPARLFCVRSGLAGLHSRACEVRSLSTHEACVTMLTTLGLSSHYYLEIEGIDRRLGCAEWHRQPGGVCLRFLSPLREWELHQMRKACTEGTITSVAL